jgi:hypothetical protein
MSRDRDDEQWHPIPNARLHGVLSGEAFDEHRKRATQFAGLTPLSEAHKRSLIDRLAGFIRAYAEMKQYLARPQSSGLSVSMLSTELTTLWWQYVSSGRMLLDFAGYHTGHALQIDLHIRGLNEKKLQALKRSLSAVPKLSPVLAEVVATETILLHLIQVRDSEKNFGGTIREAPAISPEGHSWGGVVRISKSDEADFCSFLKLSYEAVLRFVQAVLVRPTGS